NNKYVLLALLGATAGQGVVWYTGQFYALFFLLITLKVDGVTAYIMIGISLLIGTPFFIVFGWLSDRIGRLKIILAGCLIAALTYYTVLFPALTHFVNPDLEKFQQTTQLTVTVDPATCQPNASKWIAALTQAGYPPKADPAKFNWIMIEVILVLMVIYVTMVYGPIAAFLVEMFPTKIRYTSMSLPYHIGNGWFGGILPLVATAIVAAYGDIYAGLWYPIIVAVMTFVIGSLLLQETKDIDINEGSG